MKKITIQYRINGPQTPIEGLIDELIRIHREWDAEAERGAASAENLAKMQTIAAQILDFIIWNPGSPVFYDDPEKLSEAEHVIEWLWESVDAEMFDKVLNGVEDGDTFYSSIGVELVGTYSDRVKGLRPIFISVDFPSEVKRYYREAMKAWVRGLDCAALILCWSVLDEVIRQRLVPKLTAGSFKSFGTIGTQEKEPDIIKKAEEFDVLDKGKGKKARGIRHLRNAILHERESVTREVCYEAILETKLILEFLFTKK